MENFFKGKKAVLVLKDGSFYEGRALGAIGKRKGEVVFNTSFTGYQEILTDPSYKGQMVLMTTPHIGNYGLNSYDEESSSVFLEGFLVKESSDIASNFRSEETLDSYLKRRDVVAIEQIDTRALTMKIREKGAIPGIISSEDRIDLESLINEAKSLQGTEGIDLVSYVTTKTSYDYKIEKLYDEKYTKAEIVKDKIAVIDLGVKKNILRHLGNIGSSIKVYPAFCDYMKIIRDDKVDKLFLSNGPGDPSVLHDLIDQLKMIIGKLPIFGICLGHQVISLALGASSYKLKFGHHGANHPVLDIASNKVLITSQNHNYAIDQASLPADLKVTHINLNDNSLEGIVSEKDKVLTSQYHPEGGPGPEDGSDIFLKFAKMV